MPTTNQVRRAHTLPVREVPSRTFAVQGSSWYLVTVRTGAVLGADLPLLTCTRTDGMPCDWMRYHPTEHCSHMLAAMLRIQEEQ